MRFSVDLHEHLVQMPLPLIDLAHVAGPPNADLAGEHWSKPIDLCAYALVADVDPALMEQVLNVPQ